MASSRKISLSSAPTELRDAFDAEGISRYQDVVSCWDELVARCAVSQLCQALGVLSVAIEGAQQADAEGEGVGAAPDVLRLACDALAQVLAAVQSEEMGLAIRRVALTAGGDGGGGSADEPWGAGAAAAEPGAVESEGGDRRRRHGRRAAFALASAAVLSSKQKEE